VKSMIRSALSSFGTVRPSASVSQPDKLHTHSKLSRDDVAFFLMHHKEKAFHILSALVRQEGADRESAARTLGNLVGRPLHRYSHEHPREWLARHGENAGN